MGPDQADTAIGFGSTSRQCIGIAYVLLRDRLNLYLHAFARELRRALDELQELPAEG